MEGCGEGEAEVSPALIAVHPEESSVAVAVGSELRVYDLLVDGPVALSDDAGTPPHTDSIRAICFSANGKLFASGGNDKLVKVWATDSWRCIHYVVSEKRVSAVTISADGSFVSYADKFGVVWIVPLDADADADAESETSGSRKAMALFGHYCSIITSLKISPNGQFIASADRDFKIRVTTIPQRPFRCGNEIQSFCLGHTDFVSCLVFTQFPDCNEQFLISGGGDSTVRMWDFVSGTLLAMCDLGEKIHALESDVSPEAGLLAVSDLQVYPGRTLIAVAVQNLYSIVLLNCNVSLKTLDVAKVIRVRENFMPTSMAISSATDRLWTVMGPLIHSSLDTDTPLAVLEVLANSQEASATINPEYVTAMNDNKIPGGNKLLEKLQGRLDIKKHDPLLAEVSKGLKTAMRNLLIKKQYSAERRENRKKGRNDKKLKHQGEVI